jgi:hypothetical protein
MNTRELILVLLLSFVGGTSYYHMMETSLPIDSNCSFISTVCTDVLAFIWGFIIVYKGIIYNDRLLIFLSGALITEHIWQCLPKFTFKKSLGSIIQKYDDF